MRHREIVLVAIKNVHKPPRRALRKAIAVARARSATIELFHAIAEPVVQIAASPRSPKRQLRSAFRELLEKRQAALQRMAQTVARSRVRCKAVCVWDFPAHEAVVRRAVTTRASLVVVESEHHRFGANLFVAHTDWELVRSCPCPLLLAKTSAEYRRPNILVAVDPHHAHDKPASLDRHLLAVAKVWQRNLQGKIHTVHAYHPLATLVPTYVGIGATTWWPPEAENRQIEALQTALDRVSRKSGVPVARQHLCTGDAANAIAVTARKVRARIVVMGATSRSAFKSLLLGHTAQRAVSTLKIDILVVKPRGFRTPISRNVRRVESLLSFPLY